MKYFDAHAHYLAKRYNKDRHQLLLDMHKDGVEYIVNSTSGDELERGLQLAQKYDFVYLSVLTDDYYNEKADTDTPKINELFAKAMEKMKELCRQNKKIVGWGEFGMDFRRVEQTAAEIKKQAFWFKKDLEAARLLELPVVIHSGDADQLVFDLLKDADMPDYGHGKGMIHCYLGPPAMALEYAAMGYLISVTGVVTHRSTRGRNLAEVVRKLPLANMIIETDCPYLTPEPFRNERNDSGFLRLVVEEIAKLKNVSPEEVAAVTTANAKALFGIK